MPLTNIESRVSNIENVITQMSEDAFPWVKTVPITESGYYLCRVHFEDELLEGHVICSGGDVDLLANITFSDDHDETEDPEVSVDSEGSEFEIDQVIGWIKIPNF